MPPCRGVPTPPHLVIARVHGVAARSGDLAAAAAELALASATHEGCRRFEVFSTPGDASELVLISEWATERAMRSHFGSEAYGTYTSAVTELLTRPSDVTI